MPNVSKNKLISQQFRHSLKVLLSRWTHPIWFAYSDTFDSTKKMSPLKQTLSLVGKNAAAACAALGPLLPHLPNAIKCLVINHCNAQLMSSVTRFGKISSLCQNIISLGQFLDGLLSIWQNCYTLYAVGQIFIAVEVKNWYINLAVWSHCSWDVGSSSNRKENSNNISIRFG